MMRPSHARLVTILCPAALAALTSVSRARPVAMAQDASAADAIPHVEAWIAAHPGQAAGYQALARVHALAWAYGEKIPLVGRLTPDALPRFTESSTVFVSRTGPRESLWMSDAVAAGERQDRPVTPQDAAHLAAAIAAYRKAIDLDNSDALSELGLAWMLAQQGLYARTLPADYFGKPAPTDSEKAAWAKAIAQLADERFAQRGAAAKSLLAAMPECVLVLRDAPSTDPEVAAQIDAILRGYFDLQALDHYRKAYALRLQTDLKGQPTYDVDSQISQRAASQLLPVLARHPEAAQKGEIEGLKNSLEILNEKWQNLMMMPQ